MMKSYLIIEPGFNPLITQNTEEAIKLSDDHLKRINPSWCWKGKPIIGLPIEIWFIIISNLEGDDYFHPIEYFRYTCISLYSIYVYLKYSGFFFHKINNKIKEEFPILQSRLGIWADEPCGNIPYDFRKSFKEQNKSEICICKKFGYYGCSRINCFKNSSFGRKLILNSLYPRPYIPKGESYDFRIKIYKPDNDMMKKQIQDTISNINNKKLIKLTTTVINKKHVKKNYISEQRYNKKSMKR